MRKLVLLAALIASLAFIVACAAPTPEKVIEKVTVKETVIVAGTPQVVEKVVEKPVEKVVTATPAPKPTSVPTPTIPPPVLTTTEGCTTGATKVTWFIGLGAGSQPDDVAKEKAWADKYNKSQKDVCVVLNVVYNTGTNSSDALKAMLAAGNAPDIVGPVGKNGRAVFQGTYADISVLAKDAGFDLTKYDPNLLEFTKDEGVLVGIPFALFPSFVFYNKAAFDEAKLPYPPQKVGDKYQGKDWNLETFTDLARKLTVDKAGNDATNAKFDTKNVKQFGFYEQWTDARGVATFFGGGLPYDPATKAAVIPDNWKQSWKWYYDGVWKNYFMPTSDYYNSDLLGQGNTFGTGNVAMVWSHTWYTCCFDLAKMKWDIAVVPTINGKITAKLHGDTFAIMKASKNQKAAFNVLTKMVVDQDLFAIYGGMPADPKDQATFFANFDKRTAPNKINWDVAKEMLKYPDLPNHESWLPNLIKANDLFTAFRNKMDQTPGLDIDAEIQKLQIDLNSVYKAAP